MYFASTEKNLQGLGLTNELDQCSATLGTASMSGSNTGGDFSP